jgi:ComEC/Rec2-related protein
MRPRFILPTLVLCWLTGSLLYFVFEPIGSRIPLLEISAAIIGIWWLKPTVGPAGIWPIIAPLLLLMAVASWGAVRMYRALSSALSPPETPQVIQAWVAIEQLESQHTWEKNYRAHVVKSLQFPQGGQVLLAIPMDQCKAIWTPNTKLYVSAWAQATTQSFWRQKGYKSRWRVRELCWDDPPLTHAAFDRWTTKWVDSAGQQVGPNWPKHIQALYRALVWGKKQGIPPQVRQRFSKAGVSHLLAVSGLHMGLAYQWLWWVSFIFWGMSKKTRVALALGGLWTYAWVCGSGPSVLRAAGMISLWIVSRHSQRPGASRQFFWIALWGSLIWQPLFIFHVGFQMSYCAVAALIWVYPHWNKWWDKKWDHAANKQRKHAGLNHGFIRLSKPIIQLMGISLIAQLGVLPLSLYYFDTFPLHFLLANLLLVPFMGLIIGVGLFVGLLPAETWWAIPYGGLLEGFWAVVNYLGAQEQWVLQLGGP